MLPSVAIVILNYNGINYLQQFLPSVLSSTYSNKKIIVADNASTDDSVNWVKENYPQITVLINTQNNGYAGGYNWCLKSVEADYFVLLNSDVEVTANWIEPIIELMQADTKIAACQPKILSWHHKEKFEYAGACGGFIDLYGYPFCRGRIFDFCEDDKGQYNSVKKIFWASGAALFIKSKVFVDLNGFDENFFAHMEEIDLCWRLQLSGYTIAVQPASIVYHVGGGTLPKSYQKTFLNFRNNWIMLCKNLTIKEKFLIFPVRFFLDCTTACKALLSKDTEMARAIFNAHIAFIKWKFSSKYKSVQPNKPLYKLNGVLLNSIVFKYFVRKKKRYSDL